MKIRCVIITLLMLSVALPVSADPNVVEEIVFEISNIAANSNFDAAAGELTWSNGVFAIVKHSTGQATYRVDVDATWGDFTDLNPGGPTAAASFASGQFDLTFYALMDSGKTTPVASLSGELYPGWTYDESETEEDPSKLDGAAIMCLTAWDLPGFVWAEAIGAKGGITAETSNLFTTLGSIDNYQSDWWSNNTNVRILADESGIPEPATMALLALGAVLLRRKRS